jgi:hypothetical protein
VLREMSPTGADLWLVGRARRFDAVNKVTATAVDFGTGSTDRRRHAVHRFRLRGRLPSTLATFALSSRPMKIAWAWLTAAAGQ